MFQVMVGNNTRCSQIFLIFMFCNAISYLLCGTCFKHLFSGVNRSYFLGCCALLSASSTLVVGLISGNLPSPVLFIFACLAGMGYAPLICALGEAFSQQPFGKVGLYYGLAGGLGTILFFGFAYLPLHVAVVLTSLLPLVTFYYILTMPARETRENTLESLSIPISENSFAIPTKLILLIVLFYLVGGLMQNILLHLPDVSFQSLFWVSNLAYCVIIVVTGFSIHANPALHLRLIHLPALPLLGIGFLLIPLLKGSQLIISFVLLQMGFAFFDIFIWMFFSALAAHHEQPARIFGQGFFVVTFSIFAGTTVFQWSLPHLSLNISDIEAIAAIGAFIMFGATVFFHRLRDIEWNAEETVPIAALADTVLSKTQEEYNDKNIKITRPSKKSTFEISTQLQMAQEYKLTKRETEVLGLLLKGYNNPKICEKLTISQNTLKTHLRNIYRKTSVANRQELIDLYQVNIGDGS